MKASSTIILQIMRTHRAAVKAVQRWERATPGTQTKRMMEDRYYKASIRFETAVCKLLK